MVDSGTIDLEHLEQSLNLELAANDNELLALEKALDDGLSEVGRGNNQRNVTPSDRIFRYGAQGRVIGSSNRPKKRKTTRSVINTEEDQIDGSNTLESEIMGEAPAQSTGGYLHELDELLDVVQMELAGQESEVGSRSKWQEKLVHREEIWTEMRSAIMEAKLSQAYLPDVMCSKCKQNYANLRCSECGPHNLLCVDCDRDIHWMYPLHDREIWKDGYFQFVAPHITLDVETMTLKEQVKVLPVILPAKCHNCRQTNFEHVPKNNSLIVVGLKGRYDLLESTAKCLNCGCLSEQSLIHSYISRGYWPGCPTQKGRYIYMENLFELYDMLQKQMPGLSESGFIRSLECLSEARGRVGCINSYSFGKAFNEWRYCRYELGFIQKLPYFNCPSCFGDQHSIHLDGNKKLYRYAKVPRGVRRQYYNGAFIEKNEDVDAHLEEIGYNLETVVEAGTCGTTRWKAAKAASKTMPHLDETGIEVAGCRHGIAQKAINMFHGEIYGYPHYLHTKHFTDMKCVWADIICQYWPWAETKAQVQGNFARALASKPCLPLMHAKAHSWHCQVLWGGRWQDGAAGGSGEDMEQIFSYLSRLNLTTKNMTAAGREEHITEAAIFWNLRKVKTLPKCLHDRFKRTKLRLSEAQQSLTLIARKHNFPLSAIGQYKKDIQVVASREITGSQSQTVRDSSQHVLAELFIAQQQVVAAIRLREYISSASESLSIIMGSEQLYSEATSLCTNLAERQKLIHDLESRLPSELANIESISEQAACKLSMDHLQEQIELAYFHMQKKHQSIQEVAVSSKQRSSLRHSLTTDRKKISKLVTQYQVLSRQIGEEPPAEKDVLEGNFPWSALTGRGSVSLQQKMEVVDAYNIVERLLEEEALLVKEMVQCLSFIRGQIDEPLVAEITRLEGEINNSDHPDAVNQPNNRSNRYVYEGCQEVSLRGKIATLKQGLHFGRRLLAQCCIMFSPFLTPDDDADTLIEKPPNHDNNDHTDLESDFEDVDFDDDDDY